MFKADGVIDDDYRLVGPAGAQCNNSGINFRDVALQRRRRSLVPVRAECTRVRKEWVKICEEEPSATIDRSVAKHSFLPPPSARGHLRLRPELPLDSAIELTSSTSKESGSHDETTTTASFLALYLYRPSRSNRSLHAYLYALYNHRSLR